MTAEGFCRLMRALGVEAIHDRLMNHRAVESLGNNAASIWSSIVSPIYFLGRVQIFCIGMLGEYLGKTYAEVEGRPRYLGEKTTSSIKGRSPADASGMAK
jgi:hypothetical protein